MRDEVSREELGQCLAAISQHPKGVLEERLPKQVHGATHTDGTRTIQIAFIDDVDLPPGSRYRTWVVSFKADEPKNITYFWSTRREDGRGDDIFQEVDYQCLNCCNSFVLTVTEKEMKGSLSSSRIETCPACGQCVGRGPARCRKCDAPFVAYFPHWHMCCGTSAESCPSCGAKYVRLCIC
jgi:hypothetical protein